MLHVRVLATYIPLPKFIRKNVLYILTEAFTVLLLYTGVSDNDGWSAHHLHGGYTYYHNSQTGEGQWAEPQGFTGESCELSKDEIQVKLLFPCCTCVCKCVDVCII